MSEGLEVVVGRSAREEFALEVRSSDGPSTQHAKLRITEMTTDIEIVIWTNCKGEINLELRGDTTSTTVRLVDSPSTHSEFKDHLFAAFGQLRAAGWRLTRWHLDDAVEQANALMRRGGP